MNEENTKQLLKEFPKIFRQHKLSCTQTAMCWLFECGDGWFDLLQDTCRKIQNIIDTDKLEQVEFTQVKEKFGGLRIYCTGYYDKIEKIIEKAETLSYTICEDCGSKENIKQTTGYILTLCAKCRQKRSER